MKPVYFQSIIVAAMLFSTTLANAEIYRWVDANGRIHYSDKPADLDVQTMNIKSSRTDKERISARLLARLDAKQVAAADAQLKAQEQAKVAEQKELRTENCRRARQALASVKSARRLFVPDENGNRRYLSDEETVERKAQAQNDVDDWCGLN